MRSLSQFLQSTREVSRGGDRSTWCFLSHLTPTTTLPTELFLNLPEIATSTPTKIVRLVLEKATIVLNPIEYGQTSLTLSAKISLGEVSEVNGGVSPTKSMGSSTKTGLTSNFKSSSAAAALGLGLGVTAEKLLYKLVELLYNNFEKEHVIDARQLKVRRR